MGLSSRALIKVAEDLERQGAKVRRTKAGYFIYAPNGETMTFHLSPSDQNQVKQMDRDIARCGLTRGKKK